MGMNLVVDASVVVKVLIEEAFSANAAALVQRAALDDWRLVAPTLFSGEVTNAIYQAWRRGDLTDHEANRAVLGLRTLEIDLVDPLFLYERAYAFAHDHRLPAVYDCHYVVLAHEMNAECWTADRRLLNGLGADAPRVRWIGDFPAGKYSFS
jgi:predicted nucleic acid-binding protein